MPLRTIPLTQITADDLQRLVDDGVIESRQLDYKEHLPGNSNDDKKEFLADVSGLANTLGGDILYGIREQRDEQGKATGIPEEVVGLELNNWDAERLRLENILRDGLDPRVLGIEMECRSLPGGRVVVIIRIPRSVQAPHMVMFRNWSRFFARNSGGKYQMDVSEIRQAFLQSAEWMERADSFRCERVKKVISGSAPVQIGEKAKTFLHIVPLSLQSWSLDFSDHTVSDVIIRHLSPLNCASRPHNRLNFDGQLNFSSPRQDGSVETYVQVFRNGSIEFCDTSMLKPRMQDGNRIECIPSPRFQREIWGGADRALNVLATLSVPLPYVIFMTLTGVKGYAAASQDSSGYLSIDVSYPIDRDNLYVPGQIVSRRGGQVDPILKPILDAVWNAAGFAKSPNFNGEGIWSPPHR